jgi:preprotein translocase subunit SecG
MTTLIGLLFIIVCILLILIILMQRGRGGGLSGAFGGAGGHSAFGSKTGDVFTKITIGFVVVYLCLAVWANYRFVPEKFESAPAAKATTTATQPTSKPAVPATQPVKKTAKP